MINKNVLMITEYYDAWNGSIVDFMDMYYNIKSFLYNTDFFIITHLNNIKNIIFDINKFYSQPLSKDIKKHIFISNLNKIINNYDIIITKYQLYQMYELYKFKNKVLLLLNYSLFRHLYNNTYNININNTTILGTPCIKNYLKNNNYVEYYNMFSKIRLDNIKHSDNLGVFLNYMDYEKLKADYNFNIHDYTSINYYRKKRNLNINGMNIEMKGKTLFEFLYFGKSVYYNSEDKSINDGLTDYLNLFNIDDNYSQILNIKSEDIYNKLIKFDEKKGILNIIENI